MDIADWKALALRRLLASAERLMDSAISSAPALVKTWGSRSSESE
jgi:hypothetical protein